MPAAVDALRTLLRRWQAHAGLNFTRTAVVAQEADFTLDVLPNQTVVADTPDLRQCILHRLQNHVPHRLWREALASAAATACVPPVDEDKRQLH